MGPALAPSAPGIEVQIRMDDCTKEPPAYGRRTRTVPTMNFAGAKQNDGTWLFREVDVTLRNSRQQKQIETGPDDYRRRIFGSQRVFLYLTGTLYG